MRIQKIGQKRPKTLTERDKIVSEESLPEQQIALYGMHTVQCHEHFTVCRCQWKHNEDMVQNYGNMGKDFITVEPQGGDLIKWKRKSCRLSVSGTNSGVFKPDSFCAVSRYCPILRHRMVSRSSVAWWVCSSTAIVLLVCHAKIRPLNMLLIERSMWEPQGGRWPQGECRFSEMFFRNK